MFICIEQILFMIIIKTTFQLHIYIDQFSKSPKYEGITAFSCPFKDNDYYYRGRPTNIYDFLNKGKDPTSNDSKIEGYELVFVPESFNNIEYLKLFSNTTTYFFIESYNIFFNLYNYCMLKIDGNLPEIKNLQDTTNIPYYIVISDKVHNEDMLYNIQITICGAFLLYLYIFRIYRNVSQLSTYNLRYCIFPRNIIFWKFR